MNRSLISFLITLAALIASQRVSLADNPHEVIYQGDEGPGKGKHIVFIAGDHEYRGEETLPALARILAKRYGFKCSVYFTLNKETGFIDPGSSHIQGLESLKTADLMVVFLRFQDFEPAQMQHIVDYLDRGGPVVGLRTSTHAFKMKADRPHAKFSTDGTADYKGGFGRQVLGETWVGHYGRNHQQSSLLILEKDQAEHAILRGVKDVHTQCGGYKAYPIEGSVVLAKGRILNGMSNDAEPDTTKEELPVVWVREYANPSDKPGRVFTTTHGASEDILNDGFRRMLLNGCLWSLSMDDKIKAENLIEFVGPYNPVTFSFGGYRKNVRPADIRGFDTPILGVAINSK